MSRLIVALCVVGCMYAVQAKPHIGKLGGEIEPETGLEAVPTKELLNRAYIALTTLIDYPLTSEEIALYKCLSEFVIFTHKRLFDNGSNINYDQIIEKLRINFDELDPEQLVDLAREMHLEVFDFDLLSETEIQKTRAILIEFLNDYERDITYNINHSWCTLYDNYTTIEKPVDGVHTKEVSFLQLFAEMVHTLYTLRDGVYSTKKIELTNMVVKIIKRADEELVKCGSTEQVEKRSYESLSTLPFNELLTEVYARFEDLFECVYKDETGTAKTNLIKFLKNIDEQIVN